MSKSACNSTTRNFAARCVLSGIAFLLLLSRPALAANVTVAWTPSANPAVNGYIVYYGTGKRLYSQSVTVGNVTNAAITGLATGKTYYFAVTSFDAASKQSTYSTEVSFAVPVPPVIVTNEPDLGGSTPTIVTNSPLPTTPPVTNVPPVIVVTPPVVVPPVIIPPVATNETPLTPVYESPTVDPIADISIVPSIALNSVILTGIGGGSGRITSVSATSSDSSRVEDPIFQAGSSGTVGTLILKTAPNAEGSVVITVTVTTDSPENNVTTQKFTVNLLPTTAPVTATRTPSFARKLSNISTVAGKTVTLQAAARGAGQLKYIWKFNGRVIHGAASPTLTLKKVSTTQAGLYSVTVASSFGVTNSTANVAVYASPAAKLSPPARTSDGNLSFSVTGIPGQEYIVQASSDLKNWTSVSTNNAPFTYVDAGSSGKDKLYFRAVCESAE